MKAMARPWRQAIIRAIRAMLAPAGACAQSDPPDRCSALASLELIDFDITAAERVALVYRTAVWARAGQRRLDRGHSCVGGGRQRAGARDCRNTRF